MNITPNHTRRKEEGVIPIHVSEVQNMLKKGMLT